MNAKTCKKLRKLARMCEADPTRFYEPSYAKGVIRNWVNGAMTQRSLYRRLKQHARAA